MFKDDVRVDSPLNKSPMSTKSFVAIVTANFDSSPSFIYKSTKGRPWNMKHSQQFEDLDQCFESVLSSVIIKSYS